MFRLFLVKVKEYLQSLSLFYLQQPAGELQFHVGSGYLTCPQKLIHFISLYCGSDNMNYIVNVIWYLFVYIRYWWASS